ncbi:tetratricopeptide repeat protein [Fusobacterium periodonticum]|uniref:Tetratricopeptide repeat family protein n=1 Tax=Fusobacterium periodonticum 1_1_41FAA TaxID=469621 RepID=D6LH19_9FUSO|nr:tetratricopeptide repeat protein [Fusobacterium periodonticum]EFG27695.1 tetratricopeptide repeat protein [Fusobacterium periodonticum 1_1_41FAA]
MDKMTKEYQEIFFEVKILPVEQLDIKRVEKLISAYITDKNYEEALEVLRVVEDREKNNPLINSEFGYCLVELKQFDEAIKYYLKAKNQGREDAWIYSQLGWAYRNAEKYKEALEAYLKAQQLGDKVAWINAEIGMCYKELGNYDEALKYYLIIINSGELDNDIYKKTWVLLEIGNIYKNTNKFEEAVECFRIVEKIVVGDYQFYLDHAYCLIFMNHYTEAIAKIEKALELHEDIYPISQLAFCYRNLEEWEKALQYYLKAESLGREDAWINLEIGLCYKELLDFEKSLARYLKAYEDEIYKYNTFLLLEIARIYNIFDNYTEAFKFLVRVSEMSKKSKDVCIEMGKCLIGLGRYEEAIENFLKARKLSLEVESSTYEEDKGLAYCYEVLGNNEKAKEYKKISNK